MKEYCSEIAELGEKFKKEPMKKQQETMKLYSGGQSYGRLCAWVVANTCFFMRLVQFFHQQ
jgi:YidC/Oxa1 family membrane protein insertase